LFRLTQIPDGFTSAATLISYLQKTFPNVNIQWRLQEGKEHGVILDTIPDDVNLVIIPDSGSNQFDEHKALKKRGIDVIVLDHHDCTKESRDAIVVNSQISPKYPNKQFSGVGIVYKFCKALDSKLGINLADNYIDLVAIGNIADSVDMRSLETRYYVEKGLKNIRNKLIKALYEKQSYSTKGIVNITSTSFYINPLLNACIRVGTQEEKEQMFKAMLESDEKVYYKRKDIHEPIEVNTARMLTNLKAKQDRLRNKGMEEINERIQEKELLENKILIVNVTDLLHKNLTGVVANKLAEEYKRPALLIRQRDKEKPIFNGSARGYDKGHIKDLKGFLNNTNKFIFCEGHDNAHGVEIEAEKLIEVNDLINEQLKNVDIDIDMYEVDFIQTGNKVNKDLIFEIDKHKDLWGFKVDEPLIAFKEIEVNKDDIQLMGKHKNTIKITYKGIEYIKFFSNEETYEGIVSKGERLVLNIIGKCSVNEYNNEKKPQVLIEDFEVVKTKKKQFVF
jgi:single-stranded-DNA-specific exonuclease